MILGPPITRGKHSSSLVECVCGKRWYARRDSIRCGRISSCGCQRKPTKKHGHSTRTRTSPEYTSWASMIQRCCNPNSAVFRLYGARGITVCDAWLGSFEAFFADMGPRPPGYSLERIDNDKGYCPSNCRWASQSEQMKNTRRTRIVSIGTRMVTAREAAKILGIPDTRIYGRVRDRNCSHQEAVDYYVRQVW